MRSTLKFILLLFFLECFLSQVPLEDNTISNDSTLNSDSSYNNMSNNQNNTSSNNTFDDGSSNMNQDYAEKISPDNTTENISEQTSGKSTSENTPSENTSSENTSSENTSNERSEYPQDEPIDLPTQTPEYNSENTLEDTEHDLPITDPDINATYIYDNAPMRLHLTQNENMTFDYLVSNPFTTREIAIFVTPYAKKKETGSITIYLTFLNSTPNASYHQKVCSQVLVGFSSPCTISAPAINNNQPEGYRLKMMAVCVSYLCDVKLRVIHETEFHLKPETKEIYSFDRENAEIFSFEIPNSFSRIVFSINFKNLVDSIYEKRLNEPEEVLYFTNGEPMIIISNDHVLALFNSSDKSLCRNCIVTFYMTSKLGTIIELEYFIYNTSASNLQLNHEYYDYITGSIPSIYEIDLKEQYIPRSSSSEKLFFTLNSISGSEKNLYVNGDSNPYLLEAFQWNSTLNQYYEEEDIIISNADIESAHLTGKKFYMAVKSNRPGLYKIEVKLSTAPFIKLSLGVTESSLVNYMDIDYYELELFKTQDILNVKVVNEKGNVDVYGRICRFDESCTLISNQDIIDRKNIDFFSETEGNDQLKIVPKCPEDHPYCYILLAVRGYSLVTNKNKYSITVARKNGIVSLLENKNHESHIAYSQLEKFKLVLDDHHNDIENITIKITGDLYFVVSKDNECRDLSSECSLLYGDSRHPVIFKKENNSMDGIYYITVTGVKSTNFFILPQVRRKNQARKPIKLSEGKPFRDFLNIHSQYEYFTFHLTVETPLNLEINLQADRYKLEMLVCDDEKLPSISHYNWESKSNFLRIPQDIDREKGDYEKIFTVRISPINKEELIEHNKTIEFEIVYLTDHTLTILEKNHILHDSVKEKFYKFYLLFVDYFDETISFTTHIINPAHLSSALIMYISANPFPHYFTYNKTTFTDNETEKLVLRKENLNELCGENNHHCPIYLSIENTDLLNEITFSLLVEIKDFAIQIKEGFEQKFIITEPNFRAYFIPNCEDQELDIFAYTHKQSFELYVNIFHDPNHLVNAPEFEKNYPDNKHSQYKSSINSQHSLNLKSKIGMKECWPDCVILISMVFPLKAVKNEFPVYVLISDDLTEFSEGKPLVFTLVNFNVKYISYDLMEIYKTFDDKAGIVLSLTPLYGQATIYLTVSMNDQNMRPSLKSHEFLSLSDHIELNRIQLLKDLALPNAKSLKTLKLLICVYGLSDGKFILNIFSSKKLKPHLLSGLPQNILLATNYQLTFQYYNTNSEVLRVMFNRESGLGSITVTPCNPQFESENTYEKCLQKNSSYYSIITGSGSSFIRLSENAQADYCKYCIYFITVTSVTDLKGSVMISTPESLISLQEGRKIFDSLDVFENSVYTLFMQDFKEFEIIISVFSGKPEICFSYRYIKNNKICDYTKAKHLDNGLISMRIPARKSSGDFPSNENELFNDLHSHFNTYFIVVSSLVKSEYTITYIQNSAQILQSGVISYDTILQKGKKTYLHNYYDLDAFPHLTFSCLGECHIKDIIFNLKLRPLGSFDQNTDKIVHLNFEPLFSTNSTVTFKLPKEKASFEIEIENNAGHDLNYSLVINGRDVSIIPFDFNYQGILEAKQSRYYEIFVPSKGYLALEFMECFGEVKILVSRDYDKVVKEEFDEEFKPLKDQPFINLLKVNKGMIYIAICNYEDIDAAFEFNIHFYETYLDIPQSRLSGEAIHNNYLSEEHKLNIYIRPVSCLDCSVTELKSTNITYYTIVAENQTVLNIAGKCGIRHMPGSGLELQDLKVYITKVVTHPLFESNKTEILTLEVPLDPKEKTTYYVSVKAVIDYLGEKKIVNMYYPTMEIIISRPFVESQAFIWIMLVLCLGMVLGCCLFGVHFYGKYKRIEKKLLYEVEDPKNMTQISGINLYEPQNVSSIEMESKTYQGLSE